MICQAPLLARMGIWDERYTSRGDGSKCLEASDRDRSHSAPDVLPEVPPRPYVAPALRILGELTLQTGGSVGGVGESIGGGRQRRQPF
jgi:hypothetical protein